jgi:hypothetical protein
MTEELACDVPSWTFVSFVVKVLESAIKGVSAPRIHALGLCVWGRVFGPGRAEHSSAALGPRAGNGRRSTQNSRPGLVPL